jgi:hypothetical protein
MKGSPAEDGAVTWSSRMASEQLCHLGVAGEATGFAVLLALDSHIYLQQHMPLLAFVLQRSHLQQGHYISIRVAAVTVCVSCNIPPGVTQATSPIAALADETFQPALKL